MTPRQIIEKIWRDHYPLTERVKTALEAEFNRLLSEIDFLEDELRVMKLAQKQKVRTIDLFSDGPDGRCPCSRSSLRSCGG